MLGFSAGEMLLIALIALLLFGNEKLPQNIKKFFKGWNQTKKVAFDMQKSWYEIKTDLKNNIDFLDEKEKLLLQQSSLELKEINIEIKAAHHVVSQEDIDSYQMNLQEDSYKT